MNGFRVLMAAGAGLALSGCVAAVPVQPNFTVIPGEGKTEADLRADDARCRTVTPVLSTTAATTPASQLVPVTAEQYYACMASRGEAVIQEQPQAYPAYAGAYAPYAVPAYGPYGYPYGYGYGYPYGAGYYGPYVGFGLGFGYGGFYGGRGFYRGGWHGGYGRGYGGYGRGFGGGGWHGRR